jgi:serine/tyrosine/threonine adenylyltransferase
MQRVFKMQPNKVPLASLPVVEASRRLTRCLTPDPVAKNPASFFKLLRETPSLQRRARLLDSAAHFSYVSPQPLPFPFRIEYPEEVEDKKEFIEAWLSHREATEPTDRAMPLEADNRSEELILDKFTAEERIQERELLGVASQCVKDCLPQLDIGDALEYIGRPSLTAGTNSSVHSTANDSKDDSQVKARQELLDVLSGHTVLASFPTESSAEGYAPWSLRYSGHQFGQWAGQLGDGRAISLCTRSTCVFQ